ncbi:J domain-containing protein [Paenibacillus gorillae]|uniref:J domain-containing protein n=1 Tax=Paenibacillus gorillae TaxID=1243662 RepID=UPI0004B1E27E|nr:DnaJ domain-containing protein [Paenibacillus gorillae]
MATTYYDLLEITQQATPDQIKQAYRKLAKRHHPDTNGGSQEAEKRFKEVHEAYETLGDPDKRSAYDEQLAAGAQRAPGGGPKKPGRTAAAAGAGAGNKTGADFDINQMSQQFEQFFGFHPKNKADGNGKPLNKKSNPLDTTDLFNRFFGK